MWCTVTAAVLHCGGSVTASRLRSCVSCCGSCPYVRSVEGGGVTVHCERVVARDRASVLVLCGCLRICVRGMGGQGAFGTLCSRWWRGVPSTAVLRRGSTALLPWAVHLYATLRALSLCEWSVAEGADDAPGSLCVGGGAGLHRCQHVRAGMTCSSFDLALARLLYLLALCCCSQVLMLKLRNTLQVSSNCRKKKKEKIAFPDS